MNAERDDDLTELAGLAEVADLLARGPSDVVDEAPPASLWAGIEAELGATASPPTSGGGEPPVDAPVVSLAEARSKRRLRMAVLTGIAAAVLLIGVPVGLALRQSSPEPVDLAVGADLSAVAVDFTGSGVAELDHRQLRVETEGLDPVEGAGYELWLLELVDGELQDLVWVGFIDAGGTYVIDEEVDLDRYNVVDISLEPDDGDPTHSGNSLLQGELTAR